jgi:hypothetical protein
MTGRWGPWRRRAFVAVAAITALVVQLLVLPDIWSPSPGTLVTWLLVEAVVAVVIGVVPAAPDVVAAAVLSGWLLQAAVFAVVTPKDENHNLWAVGLVELAFFGAVALGLAFLARLLTRLIRRRGDG